MDKLILPKKPGVYIFRSNLGTVLYVGKAININARVRQYFQDGNLHSRGWKLPSLVPLISKIDYIICASERDALITEDRLIKKYQPFFNSMGKDDKAASYLKITAEDYPRIVFTRRIMRDGATYIGPYPYSGGIKSMLRFLWKSGYAPLRPCKWNFSRAKPLDQHKINTCIYYHTRQCPAPCAGRISFEDYKAIVRRVVLFTEGNYDELRRIITRLMKQSADNLRYEDAANFRNFLSGIDHMEERVVVGEYKDEKIMREIQATEKIDALARALGLDKPPLHIEAFDNSHLSGRDAVGCMVCFVNGKKHTRHYRRFKIKSANPAAGGDDYLMMEEIVCRRLKALAKEDKGEWPDLMLIDGGKGQLAAAEAAAARAGVKMKFIALAERDEEIYLPGRADSIKLDKASPALQYLMQIRDEVHRFALAYHTHLRSKSMYK